MLETRWSWPSTYSGHLIIVNMNLAIFNNVAKVLYAMQTCISFALHTACVGTVAQRLCAGVQHAQLQTYCTTKYHSGTQQHTSKAYPRTCYASSIGMWPERSSDLGV